MKLQKTVFLTILLVTGAVQAQHINLGIKGGLNLVNINNSNNSAYDARVGFHAGLLGHIHLTRQFALQPEITYSLQGADYTVAGLKTKVKLSYINIPVLVQYMFDNGFRISAGPQLGFLVDARSESRIAKVNIKSSLNSVDFALGAGIGYVHPPSGIGIDARYNLGLSNMNKNGPARSYNRVFQLGVFYLFKHR
ncbi:MAG: PorT family protein [Dinghuibacter sp.]|nr:PorT family protein [Dinghuibacter sp.]